MKRPYMNIVFACLFLLGAFAWSGCDDGSDLALPDYPNPGDTDQEEETIDGDLDIDPDPEPEWELEELSEDEGESEPDLSGDIADGIFWLEAGESELARQAFKRAFDVDNSNRQARFGYALSEAMIGWDTLFLLVQAIMGQVATTHKSGQLVIPAASEYEDINDWADKFLMQAFNAMGDHLLKAVELYGPLKEGSGLSMHFDRLPIMYGVQEVVWISGEIDDADVYLFDGMARTLASVFVYLNAHQLRTDLYGVVSLYESGQLDELGLSGILGIVAYLLNEDDAFLSFRGAGGAEGLANVANMRLLLLGALEDALLAADAAEAELAMDRDQSDDIFSVFEDRDKSRSLVLNVWRENEESGEPEQTAITILIPESIPAINAVRDQIATGANGEPVPFDSELMMTLSTMLMTPIGFGLLDYVGLSLEELLGLSYDMVDPKLLYTSLKLILNTRALALDFYAFYDAPTPLRDLLPAWTTDKPTFENSFFMEWECPEELSDDGMPDGTGGLFCLASGDDLTDAAHFSGTPYAIEADGLLAGTPYIAMQSPDFGGMLYVDPEELDLDGYPADPRWQAADQTSFNAALAKVLGALLNFLNK